MGAKQYQKNSLQPNIGHDDAVTISQFVCLMSEAVPPPAWLSRPLIVSICSYQAAHCIALVHPKSNKTFHWMGT
jgi:hypothetical protein